MACSVHGLKDIDLIVDLPKQQIVELLEAGGFEIFPGEDGCAGGGSTH